MCAGNTATLLEIFSTQLLESNNMSNQLPQHILVAYFLMFTPLFDFIIKDDCCLLTVANNGYQCSVGRNIILTETRDASFTTSFDTLMVDAQSSSN